MNERGCVRERLFASPVFIYVGDIKTHINQLTPRMDKEWR